MGNIYANLFGKPKLKVTITVTLTPKKLQNLMILQEPTGQEIGLRYELGRELGRGDFGIRYLCRDRKTGEWLVSKSIPRNKLRTAIDIEDVRREVAIMRHLPKHPNIVSLIDTFEDDYNVHLVMELCEAGHLCCQTVNRGLYGERFAASVMKTIVQVVQMCHNHGIMHRDLKPENFFFAHKKETSHLKLFDFRMAIFFKQGERLNEIVGSPYYMAPEVLKKNYGPEIDIWSLGIILYDLLRGVCPFWSETVAEVGHYLPSSQEVAPWLNLSNYEKDLNRKMLKLDPKQRLTTQEVLEALAGAGQEILPPVKEMVPWLKASENAKDLVKKMLNPDPKLRLTAQEVLDHPWMQDENKATYTSIQ